MEKIKLKIPSKYCEKIKELWQDDKGFWAVVAPGYCFTKPDGYILCAETKAALMNGLPRLKPEWYAICNANGRMETEVSFEEACKLLRHLRPDYSIISTMTGERLENIRPDIYRKQINYSRRPHKDSTVCYATPTHIVYVREQHNDAGTYPNYRPGWANRNHSQGVGGYAQRGPICVLFHVGASNQP